MNLISKTWDGLIQKSRARQNQGVDGGMGVKWGERVGSSVTEERAVTHLARTGELQDFFLVFKLTVCYRSTKSYFTDLF